MLRPHTVRPIRYQDPDLRKRLGNLIGRADADRVLGTYLWAAEGVAAREALDAMTLWQEWAETTIGHCDTALTEQSPFGRHWPYSRAEFNDLFAVRREAMVTALTSMKELLSQATAAFEAMRSAFGSDVSRSYQGTDSTPSHIETIYRLWERFNEISNAANDGCAETGRLVRGLRKVDDRRRAYVASGQGIPIDRIARIDGREFEKLTSQLLRRDGLTVEREGGGSGDQGADVIAVTPDGRRLVFQCKVRQRGSVEPKILHALNGTARQIHRADVPVVATNSSFSQQAIAFAQDQDIQLISGYGMACWATWGDTVYDVLGIPAPTTTDPELATAA